MSSEALRTQLVNKLIQCGSLEPEDGAHDIIVRLLARDALEEDHPPAYWWEAARNMAITQRRRPFVPLDDSYRRVADTQEPESRPDLSGLKLAKDELDWLLEYYSHAPRKGLHSGRDTVRAFRMRQRVRERMGL